MFLIVAEYIIKSGFVGIFRYAEMCHAIDSELRAQEVRVGTRTPASARLGPHHGQDSNWDWNNGLKTLIPQVLTFR